MSPSARARFLSAVSDSVGGRSIDTRLDFSPVLLAAYANADLNGLHAVEAMKIDFD
jgi:hypothetical protein